MFNGEVVAGVIYIDYYEANLKHSWKLTEVNPRAVLLELVFRERSWWIQDWEGGSSKNGLYRKKSLATITRKLSLPNDHCGVFHFYNQAETHFPLNHE